MPKKIIEFLATPFMLRSERRSRRLLELEHRYATDYLSSKGWHESAATGEAIDKQGPVPWYTYPAQMMLERVVQNHHRVFEYGAGNSSLWWAQRVDEIVSVEHDAKWATMVNSKAPSNLKVISCPIGTTTSEKDERLLDTYYALGLNLPQLPTDEAMVYHGALATREFSAYVLELTKYPRGYFDIIVVDGMARVLTAWLAAQYVKPSGFIVFDNSDRRLYNEGYALLAKSGFKRIDFYGSGPALSYEWCTSLFAREFEWLAVNSLIPENQLSDIEVFLSE